MIDDTIARIRRRVEDASRLSSEDREAILGELDALQNEITPEDRESTLERIQSVLGFTEMTAHEAGREERSETLVAKALDAAETSIVELEASHPTAAAAFRRICEILSRIGI